MDTDLQRDIERLRRATRVLLAELTSMFSAGEAASLLRAMAEELERRTCGGEKRNDS
jgi:hypothetical protein